MANIQKIGLGVGWWLTGMIVMYLLNMTMPALLNALTTAIPLTEETYLVAIAWIGIIIIMVLLTLVIPIYQIVEGLKDGEQGKFSYLITGIIFFIFALVFIYTQYSKILIFANIIGTDTLTTALFWGGTIITYFTILIGVPGYMIIKAFGNGEVTT